MIVATFLRIADYSSRSDEGTILIVEARDDPDIMVSNSRMESTSSTFMPTRMPACPRMLTKELPFVEA